MEKPQTLSVKDWLIRNLSVKTNTQERIIEAVINHQMACAREALDTCNSIEFSGFGKFYFNLHKAKLKTEKLQRMIDACEKTLATENVHPRKRLSHEMKVKVFREQLNYLKSKLHD